MCFADIDINTLCVDPDDIEHRITPKTKAIVAVHYAGHPCDMDKICAIAKKHGVKVIEDVSHAHGACWKGQKCGTFGDVAAMSVMSGKSLAVGEGGMLATNDQEILERAVRNGRLLTVFLDRFSGRFSGRFPLGCVAQTAEFSALGPLAGCFSALGFGLGLVGTASARRWKRAKNGKKRGKNGRDTA